MRGVTALKKWKPSHAKEMNAEVPSQPIFFLKPDTAINRKNKFYIPDFSKDMHYELEIVVKICNVGKNIDEAFAHKYYNEFTLGIDFTASVSFGNM